MPPTTPKLLLDKVEAARVLSLGVSKLDRLTAPRGPIKARRVGKRVLYRPADLEAFANQSEANAR
jgi:hypothetical protein